MTTEERIRKILEKCIDLKDATLIIERSPQEGYSFNNLDFVIVKKADNTEKAFVLKIMSYEILKTVKMVFINEIFMYTKIIPQMSKYAVDLFPKCVHTSPLESVGLKETFIVMDNIRVDGFKMSPRKFRLNINEIKLAIKKLAFFHAEGYTLQFINKEDFKKYINANIQINFFPSTDVNVYEYIRNFADITMIWCLEKYISKSADDSLKNKALAMIERLKSIDTIEFLRHLRGSNNDDSQVLCHGDFNANNLMFKYDSNGEVIDCKILDLQTPIYSNPLIDISYLLNMNIESSAERNLYWDEIWDSYHKSLLERLRNNLGNDFIIPKYLELDTLKENYRKYIFYGYYITCFFRHTCNTSAKSLTYEYSQPYNKLVEVIQNLIKARQSQVTTTNISDTISAFNDVKYDATMEVPVTKFVNEYTRRVLVEHLHTFINMDPTSVTKLEDLTEDLLKRMDISDFIKIDDHVVSK